MGYPEINETTIDTLRMSTNALRALVVARLRELAKGAGRGRRCGAPFPLGTRVTIRVHEPSGRAQTHAAVAVDLTATTVGLMWGRYAHAGTTCRVDLTELTGERVSLEGRIIGCLHVEGVVHEIGVRFDQRIDPGRFIAGASVRVDEPVITVTSPANDASLCGAPSGTANGHQDRVSGPGDRNRSRELGEQDSGLNPGGLDADRRVVAQLASAIAAAALNGEPMSDLSDRARELAELLSLAA